MRNFAEQSLDIARHILANWIGRIGENGTVPEEGRTADPGEPGRLAYAMAAHVALTGQTALPQGNLVDAAARCIAAQFYYASEHLEGCALAALALMSLGINRLRNAAWDQFPEMVQERIVRWLRMPMETAPAERVYGLIRATVAAGMGFTDRDDSDRAIERFLNDLLRGPGGGFIDTAMDPLTGRYDASGLVQLLLLRETLQRHANVHVRERRLPALRSCLLRYLRILPVLAQGDGGGWTYGQPMGCLGAMYGCTAIVCALADGWLEPAQRSTYMGLLGHFFRNFFFQYFGQEEGTLHLRDDERDMASNLSIAGANLEAVRQLLLWSQFGRQVGDSFPDHAKFTPPSGGRFISFAATGKKEYGLLIYGDPASGISYQLPLVSGNGTPSCAHLAYPHCSGILEAPANGYLPILVPELTFEGRATTPSFYGRSISAGLGADRAFQWRYEQPELVTLAGEIFAGAAACKVQWSFHGSRICAEFAYTPRRILRLDALRYAIAIPTSHSLFPAVATLGEEGLRPEILRDDFGGQWQPVRDVTNDPHMRTHCGKIRYLMEYVRLLPIALQPGHTYRFAVSLDPHIVRP